MLFHDGKPKWDTLGEQIAYELRLKIIQGTSEPGTKLSENQIANEYGTSRSPVRDAFRMLANEGLIRLERMGAVVLGLSAKDLKELYEVRHLIESFALKRIAKLTNQELQPIIARLENMSERLEMAKKYNDHHDFAYLDFLFHETMISSIEHNRILHLWNSIKHVVLAVLLITVKKRFENRHQELDALIENHNQIIAALRTGEEQQIEDMVQQHFTDTYNSINTLL